MKKNSDFKGTQEKTSGFLKSLNINDYTLFSFICLSVIFIILVSGLRHSFATRCIESNCDYKTVSVLLGHSNITTTLNLYVHPNMEQKKRCIAKMFKSLGK